MGAAKKICCSIMICQMTAILSGVSLMYLTVIVVLPSARELEFDFYEEPIMCTTVKANDLAAGGQKIDCQWSTCMEWCMSETNSPCMQIYAMPRRKGEEVEIGQCTEVQDEECSALNVSLTNERLCKKGECKDMTGIFNCSKSGENSCREFGLAYDCRKGSQINDTQISCDEEKCESRLEGVFTCNNGGCNKLMKKESYLDCNRKCENLDIKGANTLIFSKNRFIRGKCSFTNSTSQEINGLNANAQWLNGNKVMFIFCSTYRRAEAGFAMSDCFNATLRDRSTVIGVTSFLDFIALRDNTPANAQWIIEAEETLRIMNDTKLTINTQACSNTLQSECAAFFSTRAIDGKDGKTPDRYSCYYTNKTGDFVIGQYNPSSTYIYLLIGSILPATLFVVSCFCLFFCSKSVGVDESGQLKVTLLKNSGNANNQSEMRKPSVLL